MTNDWSYSPKLALLKKYDFSKHDTEFRSVANLTNMIYFSQLMTVPCVTWEYLPAFDVSPGSPVMASNPLSAELREDQAAAFRKVVSTSF